MSPAAPPLPRPPRSRRTANKRPPPFSRPSIPPAEEILSGVLRSLFDLLRFARENDWRTILRLVHSREAPPVIQFLKYGLCGVCATAAHAMVYLVAIWLFWPQLGDMATGAATDDWQRAKSTLPPTAIAFLFSNAFAYWLNRKWVFTPGRHAPLREFLFFTAINLPGALTGALAQAALVYFLHWPRPAALLGFILPNVLINFICRKFLIFRS